MTDTPPRPGFASAFVPTFGRAIRNAIPGRKAFVLIVVLLLPPLLTLPVLDREPDVRGQALVTILLFLFLQFLAPVVGLLFGTGVLLDESSGGTLPFLLTRPGRRSGILLGKVAAALVVGSAALSASLGATLLLSSGSDAPEGIGLRAFTAVLVAFPAYLALFALLSTFTRWAILGGFLYAFGLEGFLGFVPGMVRKTTVLYYSRSLLGEWEIKDLTMGLALGKAGGAGTATSILVLVGVAVVALSIACAVTARKGFAGRNPGRG